jgi:hypothetical protein
VGGKGVSVGAAGVSVGGTSVGVASTGLVASGAFVGSEVGSAGLVGSTTLVGSAFGGSVVAAGPQAANKRLATKRILATDHKVFRFIFSSSKSNFLIELWYQITLLFSLVFHLLSAIP